MVSHASSGRPSSRDTGMVYLGLGMQDAYSSEVQEVAAFYHVDLDRGLSDRDVQQARIKYGRNQMEAEQSTPLWKLILKQFDDLLVKILLGAAIVDFIIAMSEGESIQSGLIEPMVILLILVANATVGVVTERNAEKAIEQLKSYEADDATVLRNGQLQLIPSADIVPGDIVELAVGNKVPADTRVSHIYTTSLKIDQSLLTGESQAVEKHTEVVHNEQAVYQDKLNMLFSGTLVVAGRARGIVVGTGSNTAIGKIRDAMSVEEDVVTPLKAKLDEFGALLSKVIAGICVLVWVVNINRFNDPALGGWFQGAIHYFKIAVALAVAAIPEGLPAVVTTCLALGTRKMARHNAIVRTLPSVETLGCTTVICSDKTGTLTTNQMSVIKVAAVQSSSSQLAEFDVTGTTFSPEGMVLGPGGVVLRQPADTPCLAHAAQCAALCNDSQVFVAQKTGTLQRIGESTEIALRVFAEKIGLPSSIRPDRPISRSQFGTNNFWQEDVERLALLEFSRDRKMMSVLVKGSDRQHNIWSKGAPEFVLRKCSHVLANNGEGAVPLTDNMRQAILSDMQAFGSRQALRCLALAFKSVPTTTTKLDYSDESGLTFIGLLGMHDPPRPECRSALSTCHNAGIKVIMVTGDNKGTAEAVARQVGALSPSTALAGSDDEDNLGISYTGREFEEMGALGQAAATRNLVVLSRVEPMHKLRLVELLKAQGHVVAMTGDGVNDAPALLRADIGIAMGSGTAVAKHAADMVLGDDNFATIVFAVAEGRVIFNNTKQFIRYMISSNIGEVVAIFLAALLGLPEVLTPVQLLWVNLVTDGLPATALGFNRADKDMMARGPRRVDDPIVNGWLFLRYLIIGMYVGIVTVYGFIWWYISFPEGGNMTWSQLTHFQACASQPGGAKDCEVFHSKHPTTISMSVLVVVEMFNALNNLSEDSSLLRIPPWDNKWLVGAIATSMALHFGILYTGASAMFGVTGLSFAEWTMVIKLSAPVILVDEIMKAWSRRRQRHPASSRGGPVSLMEIQVPLTSSSRDEAALKLK
mmetsp:Transcript_6568/g.17614  ORF Transcript_6568/g.17614 Transcript_6568/m.17614 type:complete len:1038 (+) Transcript_6568:39-3152(+)